MQERRIVNRLLCADMMELEWTEPGGHPRIATALLEDISALGACLQTEAAIPEETSVELRYRGIAIPAFVTYCHFQEIGHYVGVEFRDGFRWSEDQFHPQHLLDLKKFA
jgi:hypothetical protein